MTTPLALLLSPLLLGIIQRTKAVLAGRRGQPLLQPYFDLLKLFQKGAVYSRTTSWVFRLGPVGGLALALAALLLLPLGTTPALLAFEGDFLVLVAVLAVWRVLTVLAALDTGSSFEGMGASREVQFSLLAEVAFLLGLATLAWKTGSLSLSGILGDFSLELWKTDGAILALIFLAFLLVYLTENARIPIDDPATHLELTMIHEVMVLDHSGPDFGMIQYGATLKLWILGTLLVSMILPVQADGTWLAPASFLLGMAALSVAVGIIESSMARLRLVHVPRLLIGASTLSLLALLLGILR